MNQPNYFIYFIAFLIVVIFFISPDGNRNQINGLWRGEIKSVKLDFTFLNNNEFKLDIFNKETSELRTYEGEYEFNNNKFPAILNLKKIAGINHPLYTNLSFVSTDSIRMALFSKRLKTRFLVSNDNNSFGLKMIDKK